jgi:hypothetical protein
MSETTYKKITQKKQLTNSTSEDIFNVFKKNVFHLNDGEVIGGSFIFRKKYIQRFDRHLTVPVPVHARRRTSIKFGIEQHCLVALPVTASCFQKKESYDVATVPVA